MPKASAFGGRGHITLPHPLPMASKAGHAWLCRGLLLLHQLTEHPPYKNPGYAPEHTLQWCSIAPEMLCLVNILCTVKSPNYFPSCRWTPPWYTISSSEKFLYHCSEPGLIRVMCITYSVQISVCIIHAQTLQLLPYKLFSQSPPVHSCHCFEYLIHREGRSYKESKH